MKSNTFKGNFNFIVYFIKNIPSKKDYIVIMSKNLFSNQIIEHKNKSTQIIQAIKPDPV